MSSYEDLPPYLTSASDAPPLFDGTTRLYVAYHCPYAQRAWIARNYKGLHDKIKIVAIDLAGKPAWYKEKVYPDNKVPALEHNNKVKGDSLDLLMYIDSNFEGPTLLPDLDGFNSAALYSSLLSKGHVLDKTVAAVDKIEAALGKFSDGTFFLGQFSLEANKTDAYTQTKQEQQLVLDQLRRSLVLLEDVTRISSMPCQGTTTARQMKTRECGCLL